TIMSLDKSAVFRIVLLAAGCAALATSFLQLLHQHLVQGFLLACGGFSAIAAFETDLDYETRHTARSFIARLRNGRAGISTLGSLCNIVSYFCLAAALISWVALQAA